MKSLSSRPHGVETGSQFAGEHVLLPTSKHMRYRTSTKGHTIFRAVPKVVNGVVEPMIKPDHDNIKAMENLSGAFMEADLVSYYGNNKLAMICPPPPEGERLGMVQAFQYFVEDYAKKYNRTCPPAWRRWLGMPNEGEPTQRKIMDAPSKHLLLQGYLLEYHGAPCTNKRTGEITTRYPVLLCVGWSGLNDFYEKVLQEADINAPWSSENNKLGDILSLDQGRLLKVYSKDVVLETKMTITRYQVEAMEVYPMSLEDAEAVWRPWEEILDASPSMEEMAMRLAGSFDARAVIEAFKACPVYSRVLNHPPLINLYNMQNPQTPMLVPGAPPVQVTTPPATPAPQAHAPSFAPPPAPPATRPGLRSSPPFYEQETDDGPDDYEAPPTPTSFGTAAEARIEEAKRKLRGG